MFTTQLALVSNTLRVPASEVNIIAAALQKQLTRDFQPIWNIPATISAFGSLRDVPLGYYPIIIKDDIGIPGAAGIHLDRNGQPYALVQASADTPLTCSHEALEMLADPFGNRFMAGKSLLKEQGRVNFLVEVCDPSEDKKYSYTINGVRVSDFYTPNYFDPVRSAFVRYSFRGAIKRPRQVLPGGYLSWMVPETGEWFQYQYFEAKPKVVNLGRLELGARRSWREVIDTITFEPVAKTLQTPMPEATTSRGLFASRSATNASNSWARNLEEDIDLLLENVKKG